MATLVRPPRLQTRGRPWGRCVRTWPGPRQRRCTLGDRATRHARSRAAHRGGSNLSAAAARPWRGGPKGAGDAQAGASRGAQPLQEFVQSETETGGVPQGGGGCNNRLVTGQHQKFPAHLWASALSLPPLAALHALHWMLRGLHRYLNAKGQCTRLRAGRAQGRAPNYGGEAKNSSLQQSYATANRRPCGNRGCSLGSFSLRPCTRRVWAAARSAQPTPSQ